MLGEVPSFVNGNGKSPFLSPHELEIVFPNGSDPRLQETVRRIRLGYQSVGKKPVRVLREEEEGWEFVTQDEGRWKVVVDRRLQKIVPMVHVDSYDASALMEELKERQDLALLLSSNIKRHERNSHFIAANWKELEAVFDQGRLNGVSLRPTGFAEICLGEKNGHVDFVGISKRGVIFIIEFGKGHKSQQVMNYVERMRKLFGLRDAPIVPLVGQYSSSSGNCRISFRPPVITHASRALPSFG